MLTKNSRLPDSEAIDPPASVQHRVITVVGKESVGKSQLIASLTGSYPSVENLRGSTTSVRRYQGDGFTLIDTPGILRQSDSETTRLALDAIDEQTSVLLVVKATHLDDDLADMLPLVQGRAGAVVVTFWDKVQSGEASLEAIERLTLELGVPMVTVDARRLSATQRSQLTEQFSTASTFTKATLSTRTGWRIEPKPGVFDHRILGKLLAILLLVLPAIATIYGANRCADLLHGRVSAAIDPVIRWVDATLPNWLRIGLTATQGDFGYGLLNMGPFLIVWALPTVVLFSLILGIYKASGLIERINAALHPLVRPLGLSGRDLVRVMMGFGCNVPAVISTRACSGCSRSTAISAVAFGSACSYQLPATLAVLAAASEAGSGSLFNLTLGFLAYLLVTTVIYLRATAPATARHSLNVLMTPPRPFLQWPSLSALWREAWGTIRQFFVQALPIFIVICFVASLLAQSGALDQCARLLGPIMLAFNLPAESALPVVLASIRKDGIFLFASKGGLASSMSAIQVLTSVYLAGVLLPCLVTAFTIAKESSWWSTLRLLLRQAGFAIGFSMILAWGGRWLIG
jgi:ferrous iron transport protein B